MLGNLLCFLGVLCSGSKLCRCSWGEFAAAKICCRTWQFRRGDMLYGAYLLHYLQEAIALHGSQEESSRQCCSTRRQQIGFCRAGRCFTLNKQPLSTKRPQDPFYFSYPCMPLRSW